MNYSTAVFLINKNVRAIAGTYEAGDNAGRTIFKTLDDSIKLGDFVIVPTDTRHKMTVVKVMEVDIDIDFDSQVKMEWIIGTIDRSGYEGTLDQEADAIAAIKSAELRKKRDELSKALFADQAEKLKALPISSAGDKPELPAA